MTEPRTSYETSVRLKEAGRILRHVEYRDGDCWRWRGARDKDGYGVTSLLGNFERAHRAMYVLLLGAIPAGMQTDHLCRTRDCVNPFHIELVTSAENSRRGVGFAGLNASKVCCKTCGSNYATDARGERFCRHCRRANQRKRRAARREALAAVCLEVKPWQK